MGVFIVWMKDLDMNLKLMSVWERGHEAEEEAAALAEQMPEVSFIVSAEMVQNKID